MRVFGIWILHAHIRRHDFLVEIKLFFIYKTLHDT